VTFHTGYKRNPRRKELKPFAKHPLASTQFPSAFSLTSYAPQIFDQGQTGACTGHARARGMVIARAAAGKPLGFVPSPADLYRIERCLERVDWSVPLQDQGADPVDTIVAAQKWGVRAMVALPDRFSDADPATINNEPSLDDLIADSAVMLLEDYAITDVGPSRYALVASAISKGLPVCLDVAGGSDAFQGYSGGVLKADPSAPLDHYIECEGYSFDSAGRMTLTIANSWGTSWGENGFAQLDESFLDAAQDVIVCVEASP
jgi:hypothetical protein